MLKGFLFLLACTGFCLTLLPAQTPQTLGLNVDRVRFDPTQPFAEVEFRNTSGKSITAYSFFVVSRYADASTQTAGQLEDFVPSIGFESEAGNLNPMQHLGVLKDGQSRLRRVIVPERNTEKPVGLDVRVTSVVFADGVSLGDPGVIDNIFRERIHTRDGLKVEIAELKRVHANSSDGLAAVRTLSADLEQRRKRESRNLDPLDTAALGVGIWISQDLADARQRIEAGKIEGNAWLSQYIQRLNREYESYRVHSERRSQ